MASSINTSPQGSNASRWEDWGNLLLAVWLFVSPWVVQFVAGAGSEAAITAAAWNAWISAIVVGAIAVMALYQLQQWEEWTNAVVGIWIVVSPWAAGFSSFTAATWNAVIVGILVLCLAVWDLYEIYAKSPGPTARA